MAQMRVDVITDTTSLTKGLAAATQSTRTFAREVTVSSEKVVQSQVAASVKTQQRLREQIALYGQVAAAAEKGSAEQIAAARLGAEAQDRLQRELGQTSLAMGRSGRAAAGAERGLAHAARGAISGSGAFHGLTRSLAFASGGFLAFEGASRFLTESISAAREAGAAQRSLAAQMKASGESFAAHRAQVEKTALSYAKFGFEDDQVIQSLTVLERGTGNINQAIRLQGVTADIARARNLDLSKAALIVAKVFGGQETALRRAVPGLERNAHGWDLIRLAQAKVAGQAAANTTVSERFAATLRNTEQIVGSALLPILNKYLTSLGNWLQKMNESGKLQKDVEGAVSAFTTAVRIARGALDRLNEVTGSTKDTIKLLIGVFATFKALELANRFKLIATNLGLIGKEAEASTGKVAALRGALVKLGEIAAVVVGIEILTKTKEIAGRHESLGQKIADEIEHGFTPLGVQHMVVSTVAGKHVADIVQRGTEDFLTLGVSEAIRHFGGGGDETKQAAAQAGERTGNLFSSGFTEGFKTALDRSAGVWGSLADTVTAAVNKATRAADAAARAAAARRVGQRNTWFDQMISRLLGDVQDIRTPGGRIRELERIRGLVVAQLAKVKDVTRRLNLGEVVKEINRSIRSEQAGMAADAKQAAADAKQRAADLKQKQQDAVNAMLDALAFGVDRASLTKTLQDDLARWKEYLAGVNAQIKIQGRTQELLQRQLDAEKGIQDVNKQIADNRKQAAQNRRDRIQRQQFLALGLTAEGQDRVMSVRTLRRYYEQITAAATAGLINLNKKQRQELGKIRQSLRDNSLTRETRSWIENYLGALKDGTKKADADWTKFRTVNTNQFLKAAGLEGLSGAQRRRLGTTLAMLGPKGTLPGYTFAGAPIATTTTGVAIHGDVHVHGVQNPAQFEDQLVKRSKARPHRRRGAQ